jgi:GLPGLI family protein
MVLATIPFVAESATVSSNGSENAEVKSSPQKAKKSIYLIPDTAKYKITYSVAFVRDTTNFSDKKDAFVVTLVGDKCAQFIDKYELDYQLLRDSLRLVGVPFSERKNKTMRIKVLRTFDERIIMNYPEKDVNTFQSYLSGSFRQFEDAKAIQNWKIERDTKDIMGYRCRKATCRFRGRDYEAWYAEELPIPYGPYQFRGLPGLILELSDTNKEYVFNIVGLERPEKVIPLKLYDRKTVEHISREDFWFLHRYYNDNAAAGLLNNSGSIKLKLTPEQEKELEKRLNRPRPYNPIEKE